MTQRALNLNELPVLVTVCGDYRARNGRRVTVHSISPKQEGVTSFDVKGSVWKTEKAMGLNPAYDIWHISGRRLPLRESDLDLVARWSAYTIGDAVMADGALGTVRFIDANGRYEVRLEDGTCEVFEPRDISPRSI